MAKQATVKVGGKKVVESKGKKGKKEKEEKPVFNLKKALDDNGNPIALNEGRLTAIPANIPEGTKGLKRNNFSTKTLYAGYQLYLLQKQRVNLDKKIEDKQTEIQELKSGGDPKMKKVKRIKKLKGQIDALKAALAESGVDLSELDLG